MIVPIKRDGELEDWAIIELQGDIKFNSADSTANEKIGHLHFTKTGTPIFIIGVHILHGKEVELQKPFAVLLKSKSNEDGAINDSTTDTEYVVRAIVRKKLVFRSRPKHMITNVPKRN